MTPDRKATAAAVDRLRLFVQNLHSLRLDPPAPYAEGVRVTLQKDIEQVITDYDFRNEQTKRGRDTKLVGVCTCGHDETSHAVGRHAMSFAFCQVEGCSCQQYEWCINAYIPIQR